MPGDLLLSTAYLPPVEYFHLIKNAEAVFIEQEENYIKQTYRNRCKILTSNGILNLSVPITKGESLKALIRDVEIDYSKRWQQIHLRAIASAYNRSPYFLFYSDAFKKVILKKHRYLLDLNDELLNLCLKILDLDKCISYTSIYKSEYRQSHDFRYRLSPKIKSGYKVKHYIQVFSNDVFVPDLSILDLIFNTGPEANKYL